MGVGMNLKTTLSLNNNHHSITNLSFGRNTCSRYMYTTTLTNFIAWDLISLSPVWSVEVTNSPHTTITQSTSLPLVAIVQKEEIKLVSPVTKTIVHTFTDVNCTGGAVWMSGNLFFLKYSGELMRISKDNSTVTSNMSVINSNSTMSPWLMSSKTSRSNVTVQPMTQGRTMHDIDALLALPLHTIPAPAQLSQTLIKNRLLALPRQRRKLKHKIDPENEDNDANMKMKQKIDDVFKFEAQEDPSLDLKSFCKLLKKSCL